MRCDDKNASNVDYTSKRYDLRTGESNGRELSSLFPPVKPSFGLSPFAALA